MQNVFRVFDKDKSHNITKEEFKFMLEYYGMDVTDAEVRRAPPYVEPGCHDMREFTGLMTLCSASRFSGTTTKTGRASCRLSSSAACLRRIRRALSSVRRASRSVLSTCPLFGAPHGRHEDGGRSLDGRGDSRVRPIHQRRRARVRALRCLPRVRLGLGGLTRATLYSARLTRRRSSSSYCVSMMPLPSVRTPSSASSSGSLTR